MRQARLTAFFLSALATALAGCGGGSGAEDRSGAVARQIQREGAGAIRQVTNSIGAAGTATVTAAKCSRARRAQTYFCSVRYTYDNSEGSYTYRVKMSATCDGAGKCRWYAAGIGTLVGADPNGAGPAPPPG